MVKSVIIRKFFTTTIIMPAFLKFLFWMSSDWLHFSDSKFHYGSLSSDAVNIHFSTIFYVVNYTAECARGDWSSDSQVRWGRRKAVYPCLYQQLCKDGLSHFEHGPEQAKYFNISCSAKSSKTFSASSCQLQLMNCERHTFLSQYNNAAISSHVFAHSIHFQLFLFSVIHCTSSEERHLEGAASEEQSHETTSEESILSPSDTP